VKEDGNIQKWWDIVDLCVDKIYDSILTGGQLQVILSSVCNFLYKCTDGRDVYMYICIGLCIYIDVFKDKAPCLLHSKFSLS